MSWENLIYENKLTITTGDGQVFQPYWKDAKKENQYNTSNFDFINLKGTFVYRGEKPGSTLPLMLFFQGANCIDEANVFESALDDKRALSIEHPYYGLLRVQPIAISRDDSSLNVSRIELVVYETIDVSQPQTVISIDDLITGLIAQSETSISDAFVNKYSLNSSTLNTANNSIGIFDKEFEKIISISSEFAEFKTLVGNAYRGADNILNETQQGIDSINSMLMYPSTVTDTVRSRIERYSASLDRLFGTISGFATLQFLEYYTSYGGSIINGISNTLINPLDTDLKTKSQIVEQIQTVTTIFESWISNIDSYTASDAGINGAYAPSSDVINSVYSGYIATISNLQELLQGAKYEATVVTDIDTNIVLLAHKYYGLEQDDSTINDLIELNGWKRDKFIQIKRGTIFKYLR